MVLVASSDLGSGRWFVLVGGLVVDGRDFVGAVVGSFWI